MLPRRLGARFALEALFLVLLAVGAGFAHLRPLYIVAVMAGAWLLVALAELTAERIDRSPLSYLLPGPAVAEDEEPEQVFGPRPEERTVVAPPEPAAEPPAGEAAPEAEQIAEAPQAEPAEVLPAPGGRMRSLLRRREREVEPEPEAEPAPQQEETSTAEPRRVRSFLRRRERELPPEPEPEPEQTDEILPAVEPSRGRLRSRLRRRREPEVEPAPVIQPRHVKLLPRRSAEEPSRAAQEVAELFGSRTGDDESSKPEETGT